MGRLLKQSRRNSVVLNRGKWNKCPDSFLLERNQDSKVSLNQVNRRTKAQFISETATNFPNSLSPLPNVCIVELAVQGFDDVGAAFYFPFLFNVRVACQYLKCYKQPEKRFVPIDKRSRLDLNPKCVTKLLESIASQAFLRTRSLTQLIN